MIHKEISFCENKKMQMYIIHIHIPTYFCLSGGRNLICFVMDLDRKSTPSMYTLMKAAQNTVDVCDIFRLFLMMMDGI